MALQGRMAAYTGRKTTWEQALHSQQTLRPEKLNWDTEPKDLPLAVPGLTEFV